LNQNHTSPTSAQVQNLNRDRQQITSAATFSSREAHKAQSRFVSTLYQTKVTNRLRKTDN